jgi:hypothetical protein
VTDSARVDESLLVSSLWAHWSAHISTFCTSLRAKSRCYGVSSTTRPMKVRTHAPCVVHCWSDEAAAALARGDASSGAHAPHKRHHTAYGGLRWPDNDVQLMPLGRLCVDYLSGARHSYGVQNPPEPLVRGRSTSSAARQEARHWIRRQLGVSM